MASAVTAFIFSIPKRNLYITGRDTETGDTETERFPPAYSLRHSTPTSPTASTYAASCPIQTR